MKCPDCGTEVGDQIPFCPRCGRQVRAAPHRSEYVAPAHVPSGHKAEGERGLALVLVIIVVLIVVLPLVLAMTFYIGILGFGGQDAEPVTTDLSMVTESGGYRFTFGAFTSQTEWSDIAIVLSDISSSVSWNPTTPDMKGVSPVVFEFAPTLLGNITVFCNVTDMDGDGSVDEGDFFTVHTGSEAVFASGAEYTVLIVHETTGTLAASDSFSGSG